MSFRVILTIAVIAAAGLVALAWNQSTKRLSEPTAESSGETGDATPSMPSLEAPTEDPALQWDTPPGWQASGRRGVRLDTYRIASPAGVEAAECAVYYFGPGQGGGVDANLERWIGEFENPERHDVRAIAGGNIAISRLDVRGTYLAHAMGSGAAGGMKPDWALLGAIATGPNGDVFFKLTGPAATVEKASKDFDVMLASIRAR